MNDLITVEAVQSQIIELPDRPPAMLDRALAKIYATDTRSINQAVKRNPERFPEDFCFRLTDEEIQILRSQIGITKQNMARVNPYAYTSEGCNMMSACLHTPIAIDRSVFIMRAFSKLEQMVRQNSQNLILSTSSKVLCQKENMV